MKLATFLNDGETWTGLEGTFVEVFIEKDFEDFADGDETVMALAIYHLDDPEDLRRLAKLIEVLRKKGKK